MPENREFHPKFTCYAIHVQNKNPGNTPNGYATGIPPLMMGPIGNKCQPTENDQCKILKISSRSKSASLSEELSTPFDFASQ